MPDSYDQQTGRLIHIETSLGGGLDMATSPRDLPDGKSPYLRDVLVRMGNLSPANTAESVAIVSTPTEIIRHCAPYNTGVSQYLMLLASTKAWALSAGGCADVTPSTAFTATTRWEAYSMMNNVAPVVVVNNRLDKPHYWNGSSVFQELVDSYKAQTCIGYLNRLFLGYTYETSWLANRIRWSKEADITDFLDDTAGFYDLQDEGDPIRRYGRVAGNILFIFREGSIYRAYPTSDPLDPIAVSGPQTAKGIWAPNSLQRVEDGFFYLGPDDIYGISESTHQGVGWPIRAALFQDTDPAHLTKAWSFLDSRNKEYYLITTLKDATQHAWIFNWEQKVWSRQDFSDYSALGDWFATT